MEHLIPPEQDTGFLYKKPGRLDTGGDRKPYIHTETQAQVPAT